MQMIMPAPRAGSDQLTRLTDRALACALLAGALLLVAGAGAFVRGLARRVALANGAGTKPFGP